MNTDHDFECVDFDAMFQKFAHAWMNENAHKYGNSADKLEARLPNVYLRWLNRPAKWLDGQTPAGYFSQYSDPDMLIAWMCAYDSRGISVPDPLMERLSQLSGAEDALMRAIEDVKTTYTVRLMIVSMLREMQSVRPMERYIQWISKRMSPRDELVDMAAESLEAMGENAVPSILDALPTANAPGQETFLDVLCNFPGDERIYDLAVKLFENHPDNTALYASYLGKLGDRRALQTLVNAAHSRKINYLDYIELRNAIEELGGDAPEELDWSGDPYYESLRSVEGGAL